MPISHGTRQRKLIVLAVIALISVPAVLVPIEAGRFFKRNRSNGFLTSSGREREYVLYVPSTYDPATPTPLVISMHGAGAWSFFPVADSISQFLLVAAARDHALQHITDDDPCIDDENGFNLHADAAAWLFPRVREWAPAYYDYWLEAFENRHA